MDLQISIIISTYNRPDHLRRCLLSLIGQVGVCGLFEVVVTDDGSDDETLDLVENLRKSANYRLTWTTHEHDGFQLSRCRNEGAFASRANYLLFSDGDCIFPPDHVAWHMQLRRRNFVLCGDSWRLSPSSSERIGEQAIREASFLDEVPPKERRRLRRKYWRACAYQWIQHPMLPRLTGCNFSIWRDDYQKVNGFDEEFRGWGYEDRDLQFRLSQTGVRFRSILHRTAACHLWHPVDPTFVPRGRGTFNRSRFEDTSRPAFCRVGLDRCANNPSGMTINSPSPQARKTAAA